MNKQITQKDRKEIINKHSNRCDLCFVSQEQRQLHIHHQHYIDCSEKELDVFCFVCHKWVHDVVLKNNKPLRDYVTINTYIEGDIYFKLRLKLKENDKTLKRLFDDAIDDYLKQKEVDKNDM